MKSFNKIKYKLFITLLLSFVILAAAVAVGMSFFIGKHFNPQELNSHIDTNLKINKEFSLEDVIQKEGYKAAWIKSENIQVEIFANVVPAATGGLRAAAITENDITESKKTEGLLSYSASGKKFTVLGVGSGLINISYTLDSTVSVSFPFRTSFNNSSTLSVIESNYPDLCKDGLLTDEELQTISGLTINGGVAQIDCGDFVSMSGLKKIIILENEQSLSGLLTVTNAEKLRDVKIYVPQERYPDYLADTSWKFSDRIFPDTQINEFESTVVFNLNGGVLPQAPAEDFYAASFVNIALTDISSLTPERTGYTFLGWCISNDGGGTLQEPIGNSYKFVTDTKLYASWRINNYSIVYDTRGGFGGFAEQNASYNGSVILHETEPVLNGYIFLGWSLNPGAASAQFASGQAVKNLTDTEETVILYAVWAGEKFYVRYNANGGSSKPADQVAVYGDSFTFTTELPVKAGWTFLCWSESPNQIVNRREPGDKVSNLLSAYGTSVTYYAVWMADEYAVIFEPNGGTGNPPPQIISYNETATLTTDKPQRSGHALLGWHTQQYPVVQALPAGGFAPGATVRNLAAINTDEIVLYAVWKMTAYTIRYDANGGTDAPVDSEGVYYNQKITLSTAIPVRTAYTFIGWNTQKDATAALYQPGATAENIYEVNGIATLYAVWKPIGYEIRFITEGSAVAAQSVFYDQTVYLPAAPVRTGYTFLGWDLNGQALSPQYQPGDPVLNLTQVQGATVPVYAIWRVHTYNILYDANDGTGAPAVESGILYDAEHRLSSIEPSRTDYIFAGWGITRTAVLYQPGETVSKLSGQDGDTVVLFAVWRNAVRYTVTYNGNGGSAVSIVHSNIVYNTTFNLTAETPSRTGYTFLGWSRIQSDTVKEFSPGAEVSNLTNIDGKTVVLYAVWRAHTYTIQYTVGKGSAVQPQTATYGVQIQLRAGSILEGRSSLFWNNEATGVQYNAGGWVSNLTSVDGAVIRMAAASYAIQWSNYDGTPLAANEVWLGITPVYSVGTPGRNPTNQYTYTFKGWNTVRQSDSSWNENTVTIPSASANVTYYAVFTRTVRSYAIIWKDWNENTLRTDTVQYGQTPSGPSVASTGVGTKNRRDHTGWKPAVKAVDGDATYTATYNEWDDSPKCVVEGTLITMADGTQKPVEDLKVLDYVLSWDFEKGEYKITPVLLIEQHDYDDYLVIELEFSDGSILGIVFEHRLFDLTLNKFVNINAQNAGLFVGHLFEKAELDEFGNFVRKTVELTDARFVTKYIKSYNVTTAFTFNHYAQGLLAGPGGLTGNFTLNIFEVGDDLKYDEQAMQTDIETYGLFEYEEFKAYLSYELFVMFNAQYLKISAAKGLATIEEILIRLNTFLELSV